MSTKKYVLNLLMAEKNNSISGEAIAKSLGLSRNAVWKAVSELRKDGYKIEAVTNKGYRLFENSDILAVEGIIPYLREQKFAKKIKIFDSLDSTNKTAKEMALSGSEHGRVIISDFQKIGKGRYGRDFFSKEKKGLYMSFVLHPSEFSFETPSLITAFAAVSVCEVIEKLTGKKAGIKWVNDIFIEGKKVCGILTEAITDFESGRIEWIVLGIGINFSIADDEFPKELQGIAGSIFPEGAGDISRNFLAAEIINNLLCADISISNKGNFMEEYKKRMLMLNKKIKVSGEGYEYEATAVDVDESGRLIIRKDTGEIIKLFSGEISILF